MTNYDKIAAEALAEADAEEEAYLAKLQS